MILAVAHEGDDHAPPVLRALERLGARVALLDLGLMPRGGGVTLGFGAGAPRSGLRLPAGRPAWADEVRAVWWRRPTAPRPPDGLSYAEAHHARRQWEAALHGFLAGLEARLINDPWAEDRASRKPLQLGEAARAGLHVPPTLVTSDPAAARAFLDRLAGAPAIAKPLDGTDPAGWTRLLGPADLDRLDGLRAAPVVLQAYVPGPDVRITVVGRRLFACEVDARATRSPEDWRPVASEARLAPCQVPPEVERGLRALMDRLGLSCGAVDFRVRESDGTWHFLEVNPSGQWLGIEARSGLPITEAVATLLAGEA